MGKDAAKQKKIIVQRVLRSTSHEQNKPLGEEILLGAFPFSYPFLFGIYSIL